MKVVQQLTCLTLGRPNGPAYSDGELLNTPQLSVPLSRVNTHSSTGRASPLDIRSHGNNDRVVFSSLLNLISYLGNRAYVS